MPLKPSTTTTVPAQSGVLNSVTGNGGPPPASSDESGQTYLGVPNEFGGLKLGAPNNRGGLTGMLGRYEAVKPRYKTEDIYKWNIGKSPEDVWMLQQRMMKAGLIAPGQKLRQGVFDSVTSAAYKKALEFANQNLMDDDQALTTLEETPAFDTTPTEPLQFDLPDRNDVKTMANQVSRTVLGRNVDEATQEAIAQAYEEKLMALQQQQYQNAAIDGAKNYQAPDAQQFAQDMIRKQNPGEAQAHDYANTYNQFTDLINSSAASARSGL